MKNLFSFLFILFMPFSSILSQTLGAEVVSDPGSGAVIYTFEVGQNRIHQRFTPGLRTILTDSVQFFNFRLFDGILENLYIGPNDTLRTFFDPSNKLFHLGGHFEIDSSLRIPFLVIPKDPHPDTLKRATFTFDEPGVFFIEFPGFGNDLFAFNMDPINQKVSICESKELKMKLDNIMDILWELDSDDRSGTVKVTDQVTGEVMEIEMDPAECTQTVRHSKDVADDVLEFQRLFDEAESQMTEALRILPPGGADTIELFRILDAARQSELLVNDSTQYERALSEVLRGLFSESVIVLPPTGDPAEEMSRTLDALSGSETLERDSLAFIRLMQEAQRVLEEVVVDNKSGNLWMETFDPNSATRSTSAGDTLQQLLQIDDAQNTITQAFVHDNDQVLMVIQPELHQLDLIGTQPLNVVVHGNFQVMGGVKNFKIDHPLDPENKYLVHASIESPDMMNIYNGNVITNNKGLAIVTLPQYFDALNKDFRYQLTVLGETFAQVIVKEKIFDNQFVIQTNQPMIEVSWQVTGIRQDQYAREHPMVVEPDK